MKKSVPLIIIPALLALSVFLGGLQAYAQERLSIDFPNGGFERTTRVTAIDGSVRTVPASCTFYAGFLNAAYGDATCILEADTTEIRPGSPGKTSVHILHPAYRFPTSYQTHISQVAVRTQDLTGLTADVEVWIKCDNWWGNTNHYIQVWVMPVAADGLPFGSTDATNPLALFLGPNPDDPTNPVKNRIATTTEWTLYRLEGIEIQEPGTRGFWFQVIAWYNNTDNGARTDDVGEVTGDAQVWIDDLRLVVPSGSDQVPVENWMLY
ncbi:MAG: hypothetical protein ABIH23_20425 [bacterium]